MDGRLVPDGYTMLQPAIRNLTENVAAVQFDHRLLATITLDSRFHPRHHRLARRLCRGL